MWYKTTYLARGRSRQEQPHREAKFNFDRKWNFRLGNLLRNLKREAKFHEISLARTRRKVMSFTENIHFPREIRTAFSGEVEIKRCRHDLPWSRFDEKPCTRSRFLQYVAVNDELQEVRIWKENHTPLAIFGFSSCSQEGA